MTPRRSLPWLLVLVAVLLTAWWAGDALVRSEDLPAAAGSAAPILDRPAGAGAGDAAGGPPLAADATGRSPVRLEHRPSADAGARTAALEVAAARLASTGTTAPVADEDEEAEPPAALQPGTTIPGGDDVIVSNTYSLAEGDEVWVTPGYAWIGTPQAQVDALLGTRVENVPSGIRYEAPRHSVRMDGYWLERTEVTNRRYLRFLREAAGVELATPLGEARTPVEIVTALMGTRAPAEWDVDATARQLVAANRAAVYAAVPELVVRDPATRSVDEDATWAQLRDAPLPRGVRLRFYDRAPPAHWPDDRFPPGRVDHPVRGLSLEDATALALWAGRHVPTELEWEYAARGTRGLDFPWGSDGRAFERNVNGGRPLDHDVLPETASVRSYPEGASWVGALNLLGNVAEWTSSRLLPYPGSDLPQTDGAIYRGGSAVDEEPLVVRPAYRGWVPLPDEEEGPPAWNRPRPFVGVRLARYEEPVRSRTVAMGTRFRARGFLPEDALETRVFAGVQGVLEGRGFGDRQDPSVRPGVKALVVQPLRYVMTDGAGAGPAHVPDGVTDERQLSDLSGSSGVWFGLLHLDLRLPGVWALDFREGNRRHLRPATCPPGTWLLGLYHGTLVLADPAGSLVVYSLRRGRVTSATLAVRRRPPRRDSEPHLTASISSPQKGPRVEVELELPLGSAARPDLIVRVRFDLKLEPEVLGAIGDWETGSGGQ